MIHTLPFTQITSTISVQPCEKCNFQVKTLLQCNFNCNAVLGIFSSFVSESGKLDPFFFFGLQTAATVRLWHSQSEGKPTQYLCRLSPPETSVSQQKSSEEVFDLSLSPTCRHLSGIVWDKMYHLTAPDQLLRSYWLDTWCVMDFKSSAVADFRTDCRTSPCPGSD